MTLVIFGYCLSRFLLHAYLDGSGIELGFSVFRKSTHIAYTTVNIVHLYLVTTRNLVAISQKTITFSDNFFGDQKDTKLRVHCT